ncbi:MAG: hypothetical protein E7173_00380 [Firmicutes bacterium]|nr:hypothetical protein [Bacillota bacterium]
MSRLYNDKFAEILIAKIDAGDFPTKEDFIKYMNDINTALFNDPVLMQQIKNAGIILKYEDLNALTRDLLEYYDRKKTDDSSLNLEGVSHVDIEGTDYIKVEKADGTYTLLDDSVNPTDFVTQFKDKQNASYNFQTADGVKNKDQIVEEMKKEKKEAHLSASTSVDTRDLTPEEKAQFAAVMNMANADEVNFVVDTTRNIYINKDTGEVFYVHRNEAGQLEVRKANEVTTETIKKDHVLADDATNDQTITVESSGTIDFEKLTDDDLQYIYDTRFATLSLEQQQTIRVLMEKRKERTMAEETLDPVKEEQKVKKIELLMKPHNGFTSILYLSSLSLVFGMAMILYMVFKIYV